MRQIRAGQSKIYNKRRQIYIPKLAMEALGAKVGDRLEWVITTEGIVTIELVKKKRKRKRRKRTKK